MKPCRRCLEVKPLDDFNRDKRSHDKRQTKCRVCSNELGRLSYATNPEVRRRGTLRSKAYVVANKSTQKTSLKRWRENNPEYAAKWLGENKGYNTKKRNELSVIATGETCAVIRGRKRAEKYAALIARDKELAEKRQAVNF